MPTYYPNLVLGWSTPDYRRRALSFQDGSAFEEAVVCAFEVQPPIELRKACEQNLVRQEACNFGVAALRGPTRSLPSTPELISE